MKIINLTQLSKAIAGAQQCKEGYKEVHLNKIDELSELLPHGSGLDGKVFIDLDNSTPDKIYIYLEFHHLDDNGYYSGWTEHNLILTPSFQHGYNMRITGKDRNMIKEYLYSLFSEVFSTSDTLEHELN